MKTHEITTTDLSEFGWRERKMAAELLTASCEQGLPEDFNDDAVTIMMNRNSGNVFLTNSDYQVAMMNGDKLESFYTCPYCGHEGFKEDMEHDPHDAECTRYLVEIGVQTGHDFAATDAENNPGECVNCGVHCDSDEAKERCPEF